MSVNRESILAMSKKLFEQYGYQKTTLTDIARSVGKVKTAIYYYFNGKEEIFAQLVRIEAEEFFTKLQVQIERETTPISKLEAYIETRVSAMQEISNRYTFLKFEFFELLPVVERNRQQFYEKEIQMIENVLEQGCKENAFTLSSVQFAANMLVNSLKGLEVQMFVTDQITVEGLNKEDFRDFVLYGIIQKK